MRPCSAGQALACCVEWRLCSIGQALLFHDDGIPTQSSAVVPTTPSTQFRLKAPTRRTLDGRPVLRFAELTMTPTPLQEQTFELLEARIT